MARIKTQYPGVFYKDVRRIGGKGLERSYYIIFKKDGKNQEEHVGYQYRDDMSPARASKIRGERIESRRKSRREIRKERESAGWTFSKLWDHYCEHMAKVNHADTSRFNTYIKGTIGDKRPSDLTSDDLDGIHELLSDKAAGTRYAVLQLVNRLSRYAYKKRLCDPIRFYIDLPGVDVTRTEMLNEGQLKKLLEVLHADGGTVARMMELALVSGLRKNEILNLKWSDVDTENQVLTLTTTKSGKMHKLPYNDAAKAIFEGMYPETEYVFQEARDRSMNGLMAEANHLRSAAGLSKDFRSFHGLRHSYASLLACKGVPLYTVSKLLTHSNMQMTQRYSHLSDETLRNGAAVVAQIVDKVNGKE
jgi:integrase